MRLGTVLASPMMVRGISAAAVVSSWAQQETVIVLTSSGHSVAEKNSWPLSGQTNCLNDLPDMDGSIPGWKPGLYYGADEQCKIAFGSVATACTFADSNVVGYM